MADRASVAGSSKVRWLQRRLPLRRHIGLGGPASAGSHQAIWTSAPFPADDIEQMAGGPPVNLRLRRQVSTSGASRLPSRTTDARHTPASAVTSWLRQGFRNRICPLCRVAHKADRDPNIVAAAAERRLRLDRRNYSIAAAKLTMDLAASISFTRRPSSARDTLPSATRTR